MTLPDPSQVEPCAPASPLRLPFDWLGYIRMLLLILMLPVVWHMAFMLGDIRARLDSFDIPTTTTTTSGDAGASRATNTEVGQ